MGQGAHALALALRSCRVHRRRAYNYLPVCPPLHFRERRMAIAVLEISTSQILHTPSLIMIGSAAEHRRSSAGWKMSLTTCVGFLLRSFAGCRRRQAGRNVSRHCRMTCTPALGFIGTWLVPPRWAGRRCRRLRSRLPRGSGLHQTFSRHYSSHPVLVEDAVFLQLLRNVFARLHFFMQDSSGFDANGGGCR